MIINGTTYDDATPTAVVTILETGRGQGTRLHIEYGNKKTGESWGNEPRHRGVVWRTCGPQQVPLLVSRANAHGGDVIADDSIVRISHANKKDGGVLYEHPTYHFRRSEPTWRPTPCVTGVWETMPDGVPYRWKEGAIVAGSDVPGHFTVSVGDDEIIASRTLLERILDAAVRMDEEMSAHEAGAMPA